MNAPGQVGDAPALDYEVFGDIAYHRDFRFVSHGRAFFFVSNRQDQPNLWTGRFAPPFAVRACTHWTDAAVRQYAVAENGAFALVQVDGGRELPSVWLYRSADGTTRPLDLGAEVGYSLVGEASFAPGSAVAALAVAVKGEPGLQIWTVDVETGRRQVVWSGKGALIPAGFTPDRRRLLLRGTRSNLDGNLYLLDLASRDLTLLTPHETPAIYRPIQFTKGGSELVLLTNQDHEFMYLAALALDFRTIRPLAEPKGDIELAALSPDGRTLAYSINDQGFSRLGFLGRQPSQDIPHPPDGVHTELSWDGRDTFGNPVLTLGVSSPGHPPDWLHLDSTGTRPAWSAVVSARTTPLPVPVVWPTRETFENVPVLVYEPPAARTRKCPLVLSLHGGPDAQERPNYAYNGLYQLLLSRGIGIIAPNVSGSTGYGRAYQQRIYRDWGGRDLDDVRGILRNAMRLPWCDPECLGFLGVSYGGFLALSAATQLPEVRFRAGAIMNAPSDLPRLLEEMPPAWSSFARLWIGDVADDRPRLAERSPINHVDRLDASLLILHGNYDPRVSVGQARALHDRVQRAGGTSELIVKDAGHGFTKNEDWRAAFSEIGEFLSRRLLGKE